jgi:hypothetical protein
LLNNKHLAPGDNADVDSSKFQAEEWPDDDQRDESDCSNTAENPTGQAEFDKHPVSKWDLRESSNEFEPVGDNDGGGADLNEIKSLAWKILKMTEHMEEVKKNKQQSGESPKGKTPKYPPFTTLTKNLKTYTSSVSNFRSTVLCQLSNQSVCQLNGSSLKLTITLVINKLSVFINIKNVIAAFTEVKVYLATYLFRIYA